jgi:hypothetical protein
VAVGAFAVSYLGGVASVSAQTNCAWTVSDVSYALQRLDSINYWSQDSRNHLNTMLFSQSAGFNQLASYLSAINSKVATESTLQSVDSRLQDVSMNTWLLHYDLQDIFDSMRYYSDALDLGNERLLSIAYYVQEGLWFNGANVAAWVASLRGLVGSNTTQVVGGLSAVQGSVDAAGANIVNAINNLSMNFPSEYQVNHEDIGPPEVPPEEHETVEDTMAEKATNLFNLVESVSNYVPYAGFGGDVDVSSASWLETGAEHSTAKRVEQQGVFAWLSEMITGYFDVSWFPKYDTLYIFPRVFLGCDEFQEVPVPEVITVALPSFILPFRWVMIVCVYFMCAMTVFQIVCWAVR